MPNNGTTEPHPLQFVEITGTPLVQETFKLRYQVWSVETALRPDVIAKGLITDGHDAHARHWAFLSGQEIVAAARMCVHQCQEETPDSPAFTGAKLRLPVATINRLVVHQSVRNCGLARQLDMCRIEAAKRHGAKCVVGTAINGRIASLIKLGFRRTGAQWTQPYSLSAVFHAMVLDLE